jgi:hypothetical protein
MSSMLVALEDIVLLRVLLPVGIVAQTGFAEVDLARSPLPDTSLFKCKLELALPGCCIVRLEGSI